MNKVNILGVKVDEINEAQAIELVSDWLKKDEKHFISTPNIEFVMAARADREFKKVLSESDLAIPDSARFGWAIQELQEKNPLLKLIRWPFYFLPKSNFVLQFPILTGTDFMSRLIEESAEKGWTVGFLGGRDGVAEKLSDKIKKKLPQLKVTCAEPGGVVNGDGEVVWVEETNKDLRSRSSRDDNINIPKTDILFVAFGHVKQEKWIAGNLSKQPVKIMMGVGGAFDYLSGTTPRAPESWRKNGFEWLYRLVNQPWRAKRFLSLIEFIWLVLVTKQET